MAERSIVTRLRLEIGDLKAKAREASAAYKGIGDSAKKGVAPAGEAVKGLGKSLRDNKADWDMVSGTALKAGGLLAAGVGVMVKSYADFDKQMSNVAATGSDARQNLDALRQTAIKLGADTQYSAGEAAQGIEELLKAGVSASDVIGGGLAGALNLAAAGQIAVADAAETAATAMVQFKLSGEAVPHIADLLAAAAGKAQGGVSDMAMALKQSGLVASQMGLSIEETTGTLAAFASAGLLGSDAGTSMRTMLLRLANPSKEAADAMHDLGISAYDANGNFVGMEKLAGQLRTGLGGLTQAQRDQALAMIFGSDAIRAANVLYQQGSAGIAQWTSDVDDAGFAAITAATKTDNLAGDIERLGGALDTAFIKSGTGANDVMRQMVQGAEGLAEGLGSIPTPVLNFGVAIGSITGLGLLAVGSLGKLATSAVETREAMHKLTAESKIFSATLGRIGPSGVAAAAGVGLVLAGFLALMSASTPTTAGITEVAESLERFAKRGKDVGSLDRLFQKEDGSPLFDPTKDGTLKGLSSLSDALDHLKNKTDSTDVIKNIPILGDNDIVAVSIKQLAKLDDQLDQMDPAKAGEVFAEIRKMSDSQNVPLERLIESFPKLRNEMVELARDVGITDLSVNELADMMGGNIPPRVAAMMAATEAGRQALDKMRATAGSTTMSLAELAAEQERARQATLAAANAAIGYEAALDDTAEAAKKAAEEIRNGSVKRKDALNIDTEAGRKNMSTLLALVAAHDKNIEAMQKANASGGDLTKATQRSTEAFVDAAKKMGLTSYEATQLAIKYGLVPKKVTTDIVAPGVKVTQRQIDDVNRTLNDVPGEYKADLMSVFLSQGYDAYVRAWQNVKDKTARINTEYTYHYNTPTGKPPASGKTAFVDRADGGLIPQMLADGGWASPGNGLLRTLGGRVAGTAPHPRADNVRAMLTPGEVVHSNAAGDYYGRDLLLAMNRRQVPREIFRPLGYGDGGQAGFQSTRSSSVSVVTQVVDPVALAAAAEAGVANGLRGVVFTIDGQPIDVRIQSKINKVARGLAGR